MSKYRKMVSILHNIGLSRFLALGLSKTYFSLFYRGKFQKCGSLNLARPFFMAGFSYITIGKNFKAGPGLRLEAVNSYDGQVFEPELVIGDNVRVNDYVHISCTNKVVIGNNVLMASKIFISDHNHGYYDDGHKAEQESPLVPPAKRQLTGDSSVIIEENVWLGEFVTVLPGAHIGKGTVVAANTVVRGEIPPYSIIAGVPAKVVKKYDFEKECWTKV